VQALQVQGRSIQEAIRNADLQGFVQKCLKDGGPVEGDLQFPGDPVQYIQAHGSVIRDGEGRRIGAVVVLNDITRLKQLEDIRRDFVANVSHELKTPITSIKGFLETLQEGAIDDRENAGKFLSIMEKQTDRLNAIIEDLLSLSRIEQHVEKKSVILREASVAEVVDAAASACVERAQEKDITIKTDCEEVVGRINPTLLEQALINLVDNAVKYSEPESTVTIRCSRSGSEILLEVEDQGCGIPKEHHSRIFERFYRVDKARSRQIGGTGLGLAIVKHIVLAHCGRVTLDSAPGKGTTFSIHLPLG
jgi:two-component system phosphate regulon sensor histidine kinase PhoR